MGFLPASFAAVMALATAARAALPNVTAVYAGSDCSIYPGYDSSTGTTANFLIETDSCTNPAIEGFGDSQDIFYKEGVEGVVEGYVSLPSDSLHGSLAHFC